MKHLSEYMKYVKDAEESKMASIFQFFLIFYGVLLNIVAVYYFMGTSSINEKVMLFSVIGIFFMLSGFFWKLLQRKKKINDDSKRFYSPIIE
ncbi:MAG: hypothetical protein QXR30_02670 [Candidatus Woesearchaeota archaeon]